LDNRSMRCSAEPLIARRNEHLGRTLGHWLQRRVRAIIRTGCQGPHSFTRLAHYIVPDSRNTLALATSSRPLGRIGSECGKPRCQVRGAFPLER
jgi:hypothetical protein